MFAKVALSILFYVLKNLPRAELARIARSALALLAARTLPLTTNKIAHEAEIVAFHELDALLAQIQAS